MKVTTLWLAAALVAPLGCAKQGAGADTEKLAELEQRIAKLETQQQGMGEIAEFIRPIMQQQQDRQRQQEAQEPDPNARFAVDITGSQVDGSPGAAVTVIEAFDFA